MKAVARLCLFLALLSPAPVVLAETSRFALISAERAEKLERELNAAAREGYRLVVAERGLSVNGHTRVVALLEHRPGTPSDYVVIECSGKLTDEETRGKLDKLTGAGYRLRPSGIVVRQLQDFWLPDQAYEQQVLLILEQTGKRGSWAYDSVAFGDFESFYHAIRERRSAGYEVLGLWNGGRRLHAFFEKPTAGDPSVLADDDLDYRMLIMPTRTGLRMKLRSAAKLGYRVQAAADPSIVGPPMLLLARTADPEETIKYRFLDNAPKKLYRDVLERKLNKKTRKGWRVTPAGVTKNSFTLERVRKDDPRAEYRTLSSKDAPGIPVALEQAIEEGYRFLFLYVEPTETTVLLVKPPGGFETARTLP
jgi:hypothetical protein